MSFVRDCKFEENLISNFQIKAKEFLSSTIGQETVDYFLLNTNTSTLNEELFKYRDAKTEAIKNLNLTSSAKDFFKKNYVPKEIYDAFASTDITTVRSLVIFVNANKSYFHKDFNNDYDVITRLGEIDPGTYKTFANDFPNINERIQSGPITTAEVSDFILSNSLNQKTFASFVKSNPRSGLSLLNSFLSNLGIGASLMGSFCSLVNNVFSVVKGQKDVFNNSSGFSPDFQRIVSSINPNIGQVISQVNKVNMLLQKAKTDTGDIKQNMQNAFSLMSSAYGLVLNFFDPDTNTGGDVDVEWNLQSVKSALTPSSPRFLVVLNSTKKPLGDINQDGVIDSADIALFQDYIDDDTTVEVIDYIENVMFKYMSNKVEIYADLVDYSGDTSSSNFQDTLISLSNVVSMFGTPSSPNTGDFGSSEISNMILRVGLIATTIQSLVISGLPIDVKSISSDIDQVSKSASTAIEKMHGDFKKTSEEFTSTSTKALIDAEAEAVTNKAKTTEISQKNQDALKTNISSALRKIGDNTKTLGPKLIRALNTMHKGVTGIAAAGVLDTVNERLSSIIDQSSNTLKATLSSFDASSISNDYDFNMTSSFAKMASLRADAQRAASEETTLQMKNVIKGQIATATDKFRERKKEEVDFIALRFCKLAGEIERVYNSITDPLKIMQASFDSSNRTFSASGSTTSLSAIRAGAIRFDTSARQAAMQRAGQVPATISRRYIDPLTGATTSVPPQGLVPQGGFGPAPPLPSGFQFPTYKEALSGVGGVLYAPGSCSRLSGVAGFTPKSIGGGVDVDALHRLYLLAQRWGKVITVSSAYRSPAANSCAGGKTQSLHMTGKAFDCDINSYNEQLEFANLAYQVGFRGIGSYLGNGTFIHIDTANPRDWRSGGGFEYYSLPGPAGAKNRG